MDKEIGVVADCQNTEDAIQPISSICTEIKKPDWNDPELNKAVKEDIDNACLENDELSKKRDEKNGVYPPRTCCGVKIGEAEYIVKYGVTEEDVLRCLYDNEDGDAELFIRMFKNKLVYDHAGGRWYYWNDHFWREDVLSHRHRKLIDLTSVYAQQHSIESIKKDIYTEKGDKENIKKQESLCKRIKGRIVAMQTLHRKNNILTASSQGVGALCITGEEWDKKHLLMGFKNGVVNLITGELDTSGGRQGDYIKTVSPVKFPTDIIITKDLDFGPYCPNWIKTLDDIFMGRPEMRPYLQRLFGYVFRGDMQEHIYPVFYGPEGRNGKGIILEFYNYLMGEMAYKAPSDFLIAKNTSQKSSGAADATLMRLRGARLVYTSETNEGERLDAAKMKELSGGDTVSARAPFGKRQVEFTATHTLFSMTNLRIRMPPNDKALWERTKIIVFLMRFLDNPDPSKPNELKADKNLMEKLKAEAPYIAAWTVQGGMFYDEGGLQTPESVNVASKEYQENEDILKDFIDECCVVGDPESPTYRTTSKVLYSGYKEWCKDVGHNSMAKKKFRECMSIKFEEKRDGATSTRKFFGIIFAPENTIV